MKCLSRGEVGPEDAAAEAQVLAVPADGGIAQAGGVQLLPAAHSAQHTEQLTQLTCKATETV